MFFLKKSKRKTTTKPMDEKVVRVSLGSTGTAGFKNNKGTTKKKRSKSLNIFRRKRANSGTAAVDAAGRIQHVLTWTNSEDSSFLGDGEAPFHSGSNRKIPSTLLIPLDNSNTSNQTMKERLEFLKEKHRAEIKKKDVEIGLMQKQITVLNENSYATTKYMDKLREEHRLSIAEKVMEMRSMQSRMVIMKNQHQEEIKILESTIESRDSENIELSSQLDFTKADLFEVSSNLIQTQHKLHDMSTAWPYKFFSQE